MINKIKSPFNAKLKAVIEHAVTQNTQTAAKICDTMKKTAKIPLKPSKETLLKNH